MKIFSNVVVAICCMVVLVVTGCNPRVNPSSIDQTPSASTGTPQDLTFTGTPAGHMSTANSGSAFACLQSGERYFMGPLRGDISGASYDFNIDIYNGFKGPGTYQSRTEVTPGSGFASVTVYMVPTPPEHYSPDDSKQLTSGVGDASVVVNNDKRSGTVTAYLSGRSGKTRVSGTWRCPPDE